MEIINNEGVCASVRLSISQEAVMTRQGFLAELEIVNETDTPLEDISVYIEIRDANGNLVEQNTFGITDPFLNGMSAVDGTGVIGADSSGSAVFTIIPSRLAAPTEETSYFVSGSLSYS